MRLSSSTLILCALIATAAFADDAAPTIDAAKKVDATAKQVDPTAVTAEKKVDAKANRVDATAKQVDATTRQVDATAKQLDAAQKQVDTAAKQVDAALKQVDAAVKQVDAAAKQVDAAAKQVDVVTKQVDAVTAEKTVDAVTAERTVDAVTAEKAALDAPVVIPKHPLADTSHSAAERAQLAPDDSDAALDRELGLSPKDGESAEPDGVGLQLIKTLFMLLVVVGFIYLTLNVGLRKLMGIKSGPLGGKSGVVNVVERIPLEQRRTLFVLKAAGEYLLVGTSEGGMTLISKLDTAEVERIQRERGAAQVQLSPFFQKLLSGQKKSGPPPQA